MVLGYQKFDDEKVRGNKLLITVSLLWFIQSGIIILAWQTLKFNFENEILFVIEEDYLGENKDRIFLHER